MYAELQIKAPIVGSGTVTARGSKDGHVLVHDAHSKYLQAVLDGRVWNGANDSATPVTTHVGLSVTTPAFVLYNPASSGVILSLIQFGFACTTAPGAGVAVAMLATNLATAAAPSTVTLAPIYNTLTGATAGSMGQPYAICTLPTAPIARFYMPVSLATTSLVPATTDYNLDGKFNIPPGVAMSFQATIAIAVVCHCIWEEIPLALTT
jgi:hypothetical protein